MHSIQRYYPWPEHPHPVHGINFYEAEAYCKWLSIKTGKNYHIPSSYQWVRAAKGPHPGTKYPWGNNFNITYANYKLPLVKVNLLEQGKSYEGCYNMIGNVYEICVSYSGDSSARYYPAGALDASSEVEETMTTTSSSALEKGSRRRAFGFRLVKEN